MKNISSAKIKYLQSTVLNDAWWVCLLHHTHSLTFGRSSQSPQIGLDPDAAVRKLCEGYVASNSTSIEVDNGLVSTYTHMFMYNSLPYVA